jgi:hypothetical protein
VTGVLEGELGWENKPLKHVANDISTAGHAGLLLNFTCGAVPVKVRGSVLVKVAAGKTISTGTVKFAATAGKQKPPQLEGGAKNVLEASFEEGLFEQTGLTLTTIQANEEKIEINWFV